MEHKVIKRGMIHLLNQEDKTAIIKMAQTITDQKREYFVNNLKRDKKTSLFDMERNGFGAELSFCRMCGVEFDFTTNERENYHLKADATLFDGRSVDVKTTKYPNGMLIVRFGKEKFKVDMYVLMIGNFPQYTFVGWSEYGGIIQEKNLKDLGYGKTYTLSQPDLNPVLEL